MDDQDADMDDDVVFGEEGGSTVRQSAASMILTVE